MQPEALKLLNDMLDAVRAIESYTSGVDESVWLTNQQLRHSVHWNFVIIGEALSQLAKTFPQIADEISEWRRIVGFRNQLIHGYGVIKNEITWDIVRVKLPVLREELERLCGRET